LLDRLENVDPGKSAVAIKTFSRSDLLFMDHFPGKPLVPGVLEIEMIAQTAAKAVRLAFPDAMFLLAGVNSARFRRQIRPGDRCRITSKVVKLRSDYMRAAGCVEVDGVKVGEAEVVCAILRNDFSVAGDAVIEDWLSDKRMEAGSEPHSLEERSTPPAERTPAMSHL